jgi:hypothetical protein
MVVTKAQTPNPQAEGLEESASENLHLAGAVWYVLWCQCPVLLSPQFHQKCDGRVLA